MQVQERVNGEYYLAFRGECNAFYQKIGDETWANPKVSLLGEPEGPSTQQLRGPQKRSHVQYLGPETFLFGCLEPLGE